MKTIGKLLGLSLVLLALWGCNSSTQSQKPATTAQATPEKRPFITKWKGEAGKSIEIPIVGTYTLTWYNEATPNERHTEQVTVMREDDVEGSQYSTPYAANPYTLTPPTDGVYVVEAGPEGVEGMLMLFDLSEETAPKLLSVEQFGDVVWKYLAYAFCGCRNMQFAKGIDTPNLSQCTSLSRMFLNCEHFNSPLEHWDVSHVTDMGMMFNKCRSFNQPLNGWNVGAVSDMLGMFEWCEKFNQPLASWNVGNVTTMEWMFKGCSSFNQPLNTWDVSKVENMSRMFYDCKAFNQSLDAWKIGNVFKEDGLLGIFSNCPAGKLPFVKSWKDAGYSLELSEEERDENRDVPYGN